jgi:hypothetical protein
MPKFNSKNEDITYKHNRIVRVISHYKNGDYSTGTGFLINENRNILTCWHVVFGEDLKILMGKPEFQQDISTPESDKVNKHFLEKTSKIEVELSDGRKVGALLKSYDYYYDLAILRIPKSVGKLPFFEIERGKLDYYDEILFCGFQESHGYDSLNTPFAVNSGIVSSFPETEVAGGKYENIQLNSINLGGNSGGPLFKKGGNKVCGIINGNYWRGRDDFAVFQGNNLVLGSLKVPLNIAYATGFDLLSKKSKIFQDLMNKL